MNIHPIRNEVDYAAALARVSPLVDLDPAPDTPEFDELDVLATLIEAYEAKHHPIGAPEPIAAIKFYMEACGLTPKDLQPMIGNLNRVYEVLNGKRNLTLRMIRALHGELGLPLSSLVGV